MNTQFIGIQLLFLSQCYAMTLASSIGRFHMRTSRSPSQRILHHSIHDDHPPQYQIRIHAVQIERASHKHDCVPQFNSEGDEKIKLKSKEDQSGLEYVDIASLILEPEDVRYAQTRNIDPRDLAFIYIVIGERIRQRRLLKMIHGNKALADIYSSSLDTFLHELRCMSLVQPDNFQQIISKADIRSLAEFECLMRFYMKRMRICHPPLPKAEKLLKPVLEYHASVLIDLGGTRIAHIRRYSKRVMQTSSTNHAHSRPKWFLPITKIMKGVASLVLYKHHKMADLKGIRNAFAHAELPEDLYQAYIDHIFGGHPDQALLKSI